MKQGLEAIAAGLLVIGGVFALNAWCVAWVAAFVWLADQIPGDGVLHRLVMLAAAGFGLWLSLWLLAKAKRSRM